MENKEIQIKKDDTFHVLSIATGISYPVLENKILTGLINEGIIDGDLDDAGFCLLSRSTQSGYLIKDVEELLFPGEEPNTEIQELLMDLIFWGMEEHGCPDCGCEIQTTEDWLHGVSWKEYDCTNCEYSSSDEPDWDVFNSKL